MQWNAGQDIGGEQYSVEVGDIILHEGSQSHIITTDGALSGLSNQDNIEHAI